MDKIKLIINKSKDGYRVSFGDMSRIDFYADDEVGRKALIQTLINDLFNKVVKGGREYK